MGLVLSGKYPTIKAQELIIPRHSLAPGATITLLERTYYKLAVIALHEDGGANVRVDITTGNATESAYGNEQALEYVADTTVSISATNEGTVEQYTPTIEILYMIW